MAILDRLKKLVLEKWIGRLIVLALAAASGWLIKQGFDAQAVATWIEATRALLEAAIPLVIAWILSLVRYKIALNKLPGSK